MMRKDLEEYRAELYWIKGRLEASNPLCNSDSGIETVNALSSAIKGFDAMLDGHKPKKATK